MRLFSTEQVSKYHPDKYADQVSDAILTECLRQDPCSHVACETMAKGSTIVLGGEISTRADVDFEAVVRRVAGKLGYEVGRVVNLLSRQSPEINAAVQSSDKIGAGDQGIMFGYATNETASRLPAGFDLANEIIAAIEEHVSDGILKGDAKTQVTVDLDTGRTKSVLVSVCHKGEGLTLQDIREYVKKILADVVNPEKLVINPSGLWTIGGPEADCGLTGRKIVCDQYGGYCPVGGGAFSGKDPSKVDRTAAYMARKIAMDVVDDFSVERCQVQLGYAIGVSDPVSVVVTTSHPVMDKKITNYVVKHYDLTPRGMISALRLLSLDYEKLAEGCHFREGGPLFLLR